jgi:DNA-directed RNA polymerase subunit M/transcription elongation factor TFIIS
MSMPLSPTKLLTCDGCGAVLPLGDVRPGSQCRCGKCGKVLTVPVEEPEEDFAYPSRPEPEPEFEPPPISARFHCRVCDTGLSARVADVGKRAKCPDCGALTKVPPPPKVRRKRPPQAMHGQQYGLWEVDEAPSSSELAARQPKFYPVYCRVCDTLMHAHAKQTGKMLTCPDCGAKTKAPPPPKEKPKPPVLVPAGEEYQLDETQEPLERPTFVPFQVRRLAEQEQREAERHQELYERPELPNMPLLQGVSRMLYRSPLPQSILVLAFGLALEVWFISIAMSEVPMGKEMMILLVVFGVAAVFGGLAFMVASAAWLAVLKESSEGNDRLYEPPSLVFVDWAGECFYVLLATSMAAAPGLLVWKFIPNLPWGLGPGLAAASWLLLFPVFLLSQLDNGSPLEFFSPKLAGTLSKRPGPWLLFYAESVVLLGGCAAAVVGLQMLSPVLVLVSVLLVSVASFTYFRLLGRLGWWLAESLAAEAEDDPEPEAA